MRNALELAGQSRARDPMDKLRRAKSLLVQPLTDTDLRVQECVDIMDAAEWEPGQTTIKLAEKWGLTVNAVEHYASDAARIIRLRGDENYAAKRMVAKLDEWLSWADFAPDRAALIKLRLEIIGIVGPRAERRAEAAKPGAPTPTERNENLRALLRDPPPELVAIFRECRADVMAILEGE